MADTINQFGKGIALNCGFDLGAKTLLDSRCVVKDEEELETIPDIQRANGLLVWVQDDKKLMAWDEPNGQWQQVIDSDVWDVINEMIDEHYSEFHHFENEKKQYHCGAAVYHDTNVRNETPYTIGGLKAGTDISSMSLRDIVMSVVMPFTPPTFILYLTTLQTTRLSCSYMNVSVPYLLQSISSGGNNEIFVAYSEGDINVSGDVTLMIDDDEVGTIPMDYIKNDQSSGLSFKYTFPSDFRLNKKHKIGVKAVCEEVTDTTKPYYGWSGHEVSRFEDWNIALSPYASGTDDITGVYKCSTFKQAIKDNNTSEIVNMEDDNYPLKGGNNTYFTNYTFKISKGTTNRYYLRSCCPVTKISYVDSERQTIVLYDREEGTSQCVIGRRKLSNSYPAFNNLLVYDYVLPQITPTADISVSVSFASYEEIEYDESDAPLPVD